MARFIVIRDDAGPADIYAAITALREKQKRACIPSTRDEIQTDIDELLDLL
ncbi:hypothetical protein K8Z61_18470 [Nocardioides sp. TRM66260-LWL]|uniref:hypothetical protein n=1 Tax=Nocardioides sp. TRM66260-LWL TaxID=2874478 RepID=UPI001CC72C1B|nr:hypothetical protein [Nocardioides sp. TRM66260-LWL]MBZ5736480.1 hypothetical protein [Nocardioides sp. TRM66260-LWL]